MKELIKTIFTTSTERIKNPLIGTFVIAWIAFNWRPMAILLFSDATIDMKIEVINSNYVSIWNQLLSPFIISFIYFLVLPNIMWLSEETLSITVNGRRKIKSNLRSMELDMSIKIAEKETKLENIRANNMNINEMNEEINHLSNECVHKDKTIKDLKSKYVLISNLTKITEKESYTNLEKEEFARRFIFFKTHSTFLYQLFDGLHENIEKDIDLSLNNDILKDFLDEGIIKIDLERKNLFNITRLGKFYWDEYIKFNNASGATSSKIVKYTD
jgi:hypothetical protein